MNHAFAVILIALIAGEKKNKLNGGVSFWFRDNFKGFHGFILQTPPPFQRLNGVIMSNSQEATIKISKETLQKLKVSKVEGDFRSYDELLKVVVENWLQR